MRKRAGQVTSFPPQLALSHLLKSSRWRVLERELHDGLSVRPISTASRRIIVLERLVPCVKRVASEGGVVLEVVRDQPLDLVF